MWKFLKRKSDFERGREYALSEIEKQGTDCVDRLLVEADNPFDGDGFDRGIRSGQRPIKNFWSWRLRRATLSFGLLILGENTGCREDYC